MKKRAWSSLLAVLLALCLLLGSVGALAEGSTIQVSEDNGALVVTAGDVTQVSDYGDGIGVYTGEDDGIGHEMPWIAVDGQDVNPDEPESLKSIDITVNSVDVSDADGEYAYGIYAQNYDENVSATITVKGGVSARNSAVNAINADITVGGDVTAGDDGIYASEEGTVTVTGNVTAGEDGVEAYDNSTVNVTGNVTAAGKYGIYASDSNVNVTGDVTASSTGGGEESGTYGVKVYTYLGDTVTVAAGNVSASSTGSGSSYTYGLYADSDNENDVIIITAKDVSATASSDNGSAKAYGIRGYHGEGGSVFIAADNVTASASTAVGVDAYADGGLFVVVAAGDVTATGDDNGNGSYGIQANALYGGMAGVAVIGDEESGKKGDVTATGEGSIGVSVNAGEHEELCWQTMDTGDDTPVEEEEEPLSADVFVNGTISGEERAIEFYGTYDNGKFNLGNVLVTAWAAMTGGKTDSVAQIVDSRAEEEKVIITDNEKDDSVVSEAAREALKNAVQYIVKVSDDWKEKLNTTTERDEYVRGEDEAYVVAHEEDDVTLNFALADGEELEGVYYNADEEDSLIKADELKKDDKGNYLVTMLRGGAMLLGLKMHSSGEVKEENRVEPTCTKDGGYDKVTYCKYHPTEKYGKAEHVTLKATGHKEGAAVKENEVAATCTKEGSYDEVVYCTACKTELSRTKKTVEKLAHTPGAAVKENEVAAKPGVEGSYDEVVYCTACNTELSRTKKTIPALPEKEQKKAAAAPQYELVYVPVEGNVDMHGLKGDDQADAAAAAKALGDGLMGANGANGANGADGEAIIVTILGADKVLTPEEMKRFDALPLQDRIQVIMSAIGYPDAAGEMREDAQALADDIAERMAGLDEAGTAALLATIAEEFPKTTVTVGEETCEAFQLRLKIEQGDETSYERYTFFNDGGAWKLFGVEKGVWKLVG